MINPVPRRCLACLVKIELAIRANAPLGVTIGRWHAIISRASNVIRRTTLLFFGIEDLCGREIGAKTFLEILLNLLNLNKQSREKN